MRSATEIVGPESLPERKETLVLEDLHTAVEQILVGHLLGHGVGAHVHQTGLHEVERQRSKSAAETRDSRRQQVGLQTLSELFVKELLRLIVGHEHAEVHSHSAEDHGQTASPQRHDALILCDAVDGVEAVSVASSLSDGAKTIGLHAHHRNIEGISDHTGQRTRCEGRNSGCEEGDVAIVPLLELLSEHAVETQTGCSVNRLSHQRRGQTRIQLRHTLLLHQILHDGDRANVLRLADHLDTGLDQIDRLDLIVMPHTEELHMQMPYKRRYRREGRAEWLSRSSGALQSSLHPLFTSYC